MWHLVIRVIPINILNNYNTAYRNMFLFKFINREPIVIFNHILMSLDDKCHFKTKLK